MSGLKTKAVPATRGVCGTLNVLQKLNEYEFGVELWVMREDLNRNNWSYQNLDKYYRTFVGQPILVAYIGNQVGDGHNMAKRRNPATGEEFYSFMDGTAERIVGTLSEDEKDFTLVERDGHTWLKAKGRLFAFYAPELVAKIVKQGTMDVSAETEVTESHKEGDVDVFTKWTGLGVTILGDKVNPAIPGASIAKLAAMQEEFKTLKLRAAALHTAAEDGSAKLKQKGLRRTMNKRMMEQMQTRFPNHKVLSMSEDGMNVALLDASGNLFGYTFNADDNGEVAERKIAPLTAAHVVLTVGDVELNADVADVVDYTVAATKTTDGSVKQLSDELASAKEQIRAMQEAENLRRVEACKATAKATLASFNANRADKVAEDAIKAIETDIEGGVYTNCADKDGKWTGEEQVRRAVLAVCGEAVMEADRKQAESHKNAYAWNNAKNSGGAESGIAGMLSRIGKNA
nr:MAG TPA: hypothetical protein [Caudoviricetes sp.]